MSAMETEESKALLNNKRFAEIVKISNFTQEEFAEEIGISDRYVRTLMRENKKVSVDLAYKISILANCSIESMLIIKNKEDE